MQTVRPFVSFDAAADPRTGQGWPGVETARRGHLPLAGHDARFAFVHQSSNVILGWPGAGALGSWTMLPDLTSPDTRTVLPMNDALHGAAHLAAGAQPVQGRAGGQLAQVGPAGHEVRHDDVTVDERGSFARLPAHEDAPGRMGCGLPAAAGAAALPSPLLTRRPGTGPR